MNYLSNVIKDASGRITSWFQGTLQYRVLRDSQGRPLQVTQFPKDPYNGVMGFTYNPDGTLDSVKDLGLIDPVITNVLKEEALNKGGVAVTAAAGPGGVVEFSEEVANAIAALGGTSGLQFQATATHLQWKTADTSWTNLVSLAEIGGTDFSLIEWQVSATHLQWRFDGVNWVDVIALSELGVTGGDVGVTDHGALTGLSDDDHGQYHNDARGDARYYTKAQVDTSLSGKAAASHTHSISSVVGLQTALDSKQATITVSATAPASPVEGQLWVQVS